MRLSNIFELSSLTPSPETGMNPAPKPGSDAAAAGANTIRGVTGQSGSVVAKALGTLGQGKTLTPGLAKALDPYADALTKILSDPQLRTKFVQLMKQTQKQESVTEDQDSVDAVASSITRRIMMQHVDLLSKYGPVKVMAAIDDVAEFAGGNGLDEIGSSDVSIWTKQVVQDLEAGHYDHVEENDEINRVRKLAGLPEGMVDIEYGVDPKLQKLVDIGHLLRKTLDVSSGVKWDDADFNKAANLADALISLGATFGPKNLKGALKLADMDITQAQDLIAKASQRASVEEDDQLDELSKGTLGSYVKKAADSTRINTRWAARTGDRDAEDIVDKRRKGINKAVDKLTKEEVEGDEVDTVTMDVPLLLRVLEFAREEVQEDMDLHDLAERMIAMSKDGPLSMDDYDSIVGSVEELPAPDSEPVDEVSNKTLSSYTDKAAKERDAYHADRNKDAESARKYHNRKAGVRKALSITQEDEQLDELSPQTLGSYVSKSVKDEKERRAHGIRVRDELRAATGKNFGTPIDRKLYSPTASRAAGQKRAIDKLTGKTKVPAQEGYYTPGPETMPGAVGPQETTTVSFNQSKQMGDATLNINASAKDMEELHRILKLAGIDYASDSGEQEPNMQDVAVALEPHAPEAPAEEPCGCEDEEPADVKYSTDKQTLINVLRDKLQKRLA